MTPTPRISTATIALLTLALATLMFFGAMLVIGAIALLSMRLPPHATELGMFATDDGIFITSVPTVGHVMTNVSSLQPTDTPPARLASLSIQATAEPVIGSPISFQVPEPLVIPGPLVDPDISLFSEPVAVPLEIRIPALDIEAPVLGVGLTMTNAMASPRGILIDDPLWQTVFWYRGGDIPGDIGTATFAGHFDDALGRPAVFAFLDELLIGDVIFVRDERSGLDIPFIVNEIQSYTAEQSAAPAVLARIFGFRSISGGELQPMSDQLSHLTLITCGGAWVSGSFNLRLVVYATRASYPL